ncbi:c-type cytochrome [Sphingomonas immobilis]|uniref:C-type cytochrome n=1 Tax=Sphingomonas immobilis TaxID=3063997 RepID=A0ABT9A1E0_9SPHN|nr:c-type cytochrome [Sphingomonas sp. CA1-15]MDO7843199.1 c-type cytochrome [Sphingomonas sp. CA1-15]
MRNGLITLGVASAIFAIAGAGAQGGDTRSKGQVLFENRCARCHGIGGDGGVGLAPPLPGVIGRKIASRDDFLYSAALKARTGAWTPELVDQYLANPQAFAPGADMEVPSPDPVERQAIIQYLTTLPTTAPPRS